MIPLSIVQRRAWPSQLGEKIDGSLLGVILLEDAGEYTHAVRSGLEAKRHAVGRNAAGGKHGYILNTLRESPQFAEADAYVSRLAGRGEDGAEEDVVGAVADGLLRLRHVVRREADDCVDGQPFPSGLDAIAARPDVIMNAELLGHRQAPVDGDHRAGREHPDALDELFGAAPERGRVSVVVAQMNPGHFLGHL